jgi:hypothetical protein
MFHIFYPVKGHIPNDAIKIITSHCGDAQGIPAASSRKPEKPDTKQHGRGASPAVFHLLCAQQRTVPCCMVSADPEYNFRSAAKSDGGFLIAPAISGS